MYSFWNLNECLRFRPNLAVFSPTGLSLCPQAVLWVRWVWVRPLEGVKQRSECWLWGKYYSFGGPCPPPTPHLHSILWAGLDNPAEGVEEDGPPRWRWSSGAGVLNEVVHLPRPPGPYCAHLRQSCPLRLRQDLFILITGEDNIHYAYLFTKMECYLFWLLKL